MTVEPDAYRSWTPAAQHAALERLRRAQNEAWRPFYCRDPGCNGLPHADEGEWSWPHARADQRPPTDAEWLVWMLKSGRGAGKTRTGSEYTHRMAEVTGRIALVGATGADVRDTMLEGESGLLTIARPGFRPDYQPSKRRLTWPNGAIGTTFSAEEPDRLRGPEHGYAWCDEPAHWPLVQEAWDNLMFGLRIGKRPRVCVSTTPKPRPWVKELVKEATTRISTASTYANLSNLAPAFAERIIKRYEGTRLGRQELLGEVLEDVEGALWRWDMIEPFRLQSHPALVRVVVGVDPAGTARTSSDETGIVICGIDRDGELYVLGDRSGRMSPHGWAKAVEAAVDDFSADAVIAETNYGGDMVRSNLTTSAVKARILTVHSRRGKSLRAEPIVGVYEQQHAHHVGVFADLEDQQTSWQPYEDRESPDRVDALVHACTALLGRRATTTVESPSALRKKMQAQPRRHLGQLPYDPRYGRRG